MRENLRQKYLNGEKKISFTAELAEVYYKPELGKNTILLKNIIKDNNILEDHLWITNKDLRIKYIADNPKQHIGKKLLLTGEIVQYYHLRSRCRMLDYNVTKLRKVVSM